jgi:hypothetical protein
MFDSVVSQVDRFDVLQFHEDFVRKFLDLVVSEIQYPQIRQVPEDIFGQMLDLVVEQPQLVKILKMLEVCAFDEFDLLVGHFKCIQFLESFTDSSENVVERRKVNVQARLTEMLSDAFIRSINLQVVLLGVRDREIEPL